MTNISQKDFYQEIERIERNSHSFLKYFGVFWGAMLIFIVQNYSQNGIAYTIGTQITNFFINPFGVVNILGFFLLFIGGLYVLMSLVTLCVSASTVSTWKVPEKKYKEYVEKGRDLLVKSIRMGVLGSLAFFLLFIISLMNVHETLSNSTLLLGQIFFWILFAVIFFVDPVHVAFERRWRNVLTWINIIVAYFIGATFIVVKIASIGHIWMIIFLWTILIYFLVRLVLSLWNQPFIFTVWIMKVLPTIPEKK